MKSTPKSALAFIGAFALVLGAGSAWAGQTGAQSGAPGQLMVAQSDNAAEHHPSEQAAHEESTGNPGMQEEQNGMQEEENGMQEEQNGMQEEEQGMQEEQQGMQEEEKGMQEEENGMEQEEQSNGESD